MTTRRATQPTQHDPPSTAPARQPLSIRPYQSSDHAAVTELNRYGLAAVGVPPDADVYAGDLADDAAAYRTDRAALLVGEVDGVVVAMGALWAVDADTCEILRMRVGPSYQGQGYARALLTALEERARSYGYIRAVLLTGPGQHPAIDLYRSAGYVERNRYDFGDLAGVYLTKHL